MIEQCPYVAHQIGVRVARSPGAVTASARQVVRDAAEVRRQTRDGRDERFGYVGDAVNEQQRRSGSPSEVRQAIAARVADALLRLAPKARRRLVEVKRRQR